MQIKINLEELFSTSKDINSTVQLPSDRSMEFQQSQEIHFELNKNIFEDNLPSQDISVIHPPKSHTSFKSNISKQTRNPGERLYYDSQMDEVRKVKERQKMMQDKRQDAKKTFTFAPFINQHSKKIVESKKTPQLRPKQKNKEKQRVPQKTTKQIQQQNALKQCSFRPKILTKSSKMAQSSSRQQIFNNLHAQHKMKQMKKRLINSEIQEENSRLKRQPSGTEFQTFLKRNQQFNERLSKKRQVISQVTRNYDLKTGQKLFSPKIIEHKPFSLHTSSSTKGISKNERIMSSATHLNQQQDFPQIKMPHSVFGKKKRNNNEIMINQFNAINIREEDENQKQEAEDQDEIDEKYKLYEQQFEKRYGNPSESGSEQKKSFLDEGQQQQFIEQYNQEEEYEHEQHEAKGFQISEVMKNQLNASEQEEPRNNYVMELLNNLISEKNSQKEKSQQDRESSRSKSQRQSPKKSTDQLEEYQKSENQHQVTVSNEASLEGVDAISI